MKHALLHSVLAVLLLAGCQYEFPLSAEHTISIAPAVLGLWEPIADEGKGTKQNERLVILRFSDFEYLIHYPVGKVGLYYRGYPIRIGDIPCVQLQVIGTKDGPPQEDEKKLFHVVSYQLADGKLVIKNLNAELVDDKLKTKAGLVKSFLDHKDDENLFTNPDSFRRIAE
ncbi:MAG: hypothetical protein VX911_04440 [Candidatus Latescibacterota bacterium]|nr:hypothetical protein [Candidatus Latescibacterota bacterium]